MIRPLRDIRIGCRTFPCNPRVATVSIARYTTAIVVAGMIAVPAAAQDASVGIVPAPTRVTPGAGRFTLDGATHFVLSDPADSELRRITEFIAEPMRLGSGLALPVRYGASRARGAIVLRVGSGPAASSPYDWADRVPEDYRLRVAPDSIVIEATTHAGLFRAVQTLRQLLPPSFEAAFRTTSTGWPARARPAAPGSSSTAWTIASVDIVDAPRFPWRGMHLDVGRHFFPIEFIREYIDLIAAYRMNVFHWHLTEDQGWRIEIGAYPRLTSVGAFRPETMLERNFDPYVGDGVPHGGFYTRDQVREIVAYAASRYVTIVPEIELPGHSVAALAAYPELACTPGPFEVSRVWGVTEDIYCPSEQTFEFLENVFDEVMALFPGRYIHIGGDEAPKRAWQESTLAQNVIRREGLADEHELQSWFIRRIERVLAAGGRRLIGWDEILEGGLAPDATVMSWRGMDGGIAAAREGHDVIMTPTSHVYFDYYQGNPRDEPLGIGGFLPLETVYAYEPVPQQLTRVESAHVIGTQGNVWTEYMATQDHVEYMIMPRMLALAEVAWSPRAARDWSGFTRRLPAQFRRLDALGVRYRLPDVGGLGAGRLTLEDSVRIALDVPVAGATIRYTLDGTEPTVRSAAYVRPFDVAVDESGVVVSARAFLADGRATAVRSARFARTALRDAITPGEILPGLRSDYFEGVFASADDVRSVEPLRTTTAGAIGLAGDERDERFGRRFTGFVRVPSDGIWTFALTSDDGSRLYIGDALVIDHDGPHGSTEKTGEVALRAGWHPIEVTFFQAGGGKSLSLRMAPQGEPPADIPQDQLNRAR